MIEPELAWFGEYRQFFMRLLAKRGAEFSYDVPTVLERPEFVWPVRGAADRQK